jgi:hypothetical protein
VEVQVLHVVKVTHQVSRDAAYCGDFLNAGDCFCHLPFRRGLAFNPGFPLPNHRNCKDPSYYDFFSCGGCIGSCAGYGSCLNLDFHCAEGLGCEVSCTAQHSCEGLTMYCPDNEVCKLKCYATPSCDGAKVICGAGTMSLDAFTCGPIQ